jgi:hypothetical protein
MKGSPLALYEIPPLLGINERWTHDDQAQNTRAMKTLTFADSYEEAEAIAKEQREHWSDTRA